MEEADDSEDDSDAVDELVSSDDADDFVETDEVLSDDGEPGVEAEDLRELEVDELELTVLVDDEDVSLDKEAELMLDSDERVDQDEGVDIDVSLLRLLLLKLLGVDSELADEVVVGDENDAVLDDKSLSDDSLRESDETEVDDEEMEDPLTVDVDDRLLDDSDDLDEFDCDDHWLDDVLLIASDTPAWTNRVSPGFRTMLSVMRTLRLVLIASTAKVVSSPPMVAVTWYSRGHDPWLKFRDTEWTTTGSSLANV